MAQMITVKCTSCGSQRKVPESANAVACRKCGERMEAPQRAAAMATATVAKEASARPAARRSQRRRAAQARGSRQSGRADAQQVQPGEADGGRRPGRPQKTDNTPIIMTVILGCAMLIAGFFLLVSGPDRERTFKKDDRSDSTRTSGSSGATSAVIEPWQVCVKFKNQVALSSGPGILEHLNVSRHAQANGRDEPSGTSQEEKYAESLRHDLPDWFREVYLSAENESPGSSSNEVIVTGHRNRKPVMEFKLTRTDGASRWRVYDFRVLGTEKPDAGSTSSGIATLAPGGEYEPGQEGAPTGTGTRSDSRRAPSGLPASSLPEHLQDYSNTTDEDRSRVGKAIADLMSGDPSRETASWHRIRDVGQRSIPIIIRYLKATKIDEDNFTSANSLLNILGEIAPGDFGEKPAVADLMSGEDAAVRNKIWEWRDWWKLNHKRFRE